MLIGIPLSRLTSDALVVNLLCHAHASFVYSTDAGLDCFEALPVIAERRLDAAQLIGERPDVAGQLADLVRDRVYGLDRTVKIIPDVGVVIVGDLRVRRAGGGAGLLDTLEDVRELGFEPSAHLARDQGDDTCHRDDDGDDECGQRVCHFRVREQLSHGWPERPRQLPGSKERHQRRREPPQRTHRRVLQRRPSR